MMTRFSRDQQILEAAEDREKEVASKGADSTQSHQQPLITTPDMVETFVKKDIRAIQLEALIDSRREDHTKAAEEAVRHQNTEEVAHQTKGTTQREGNTPKTITISTITVLTTIWVHHQIGTMITLNTERGTDHHREEVVLHALQEADPIPET